MAEDKTEVVLKVDFHPNVRRYIFWFYTIVLTASIVGIPFLPFWFLGIGQRISKKYYKALHCDLTTQNLRFQKGILVTVEKTIPLENIQDLTFVEGPLLKYFKLSSLRIETAGNSSQGSSDMSLLGIVNPQQLKKQVFQYREQLRERKSSGDSESETVSLLREILDEVKKINKSK